MPLLGETKKTMTILEFEHTHLGAYLVGAFAIACLSADSAQGFIERNRLNRKWLLLYGVLCIFAYLYARPFIRVGIGSAQRGYINFSTLYIVWLCSAVFYHLPSLEQLGLDVRADVSLLIVVFLSSLAALALLVGLHAAAMSARLLPRRAYLPAAAFGARGLPTGAAGGLRGRAGLSGGGRGSGGGGGGGLRELWVLLLLNSTIIAVACSTYYSFCGNGTLVVDRGTPALKAAVCAKWLHPILTSHYPRFASWMLYGEGSAQKLAGSGVALGPEHPSTQNTSLTAVSLLVLNATLANGSSSGGADSGAGSSTGYISVDFPLDGRGVQSVQAGDVLSPVLCMWVTLVAVYVANTLAGHPRLVQAAAADAISGSGSSNSSNSSGFSVTGGGGAGGAGSSSGSPTSGGRGRRGPRPDNGNAASNVRRVASFRRGQAAATMAGLAAAAEPPMPPPPGAAGGGAEVARKGRHRSLEVKRPISKGFGRAATAASAAARGAAAASALAAAAGGAAARGGAAVAVAAARRSLSSLRGLAASTIRLRRAASEYLHNSHPYLPALLGKVRRGMAALEPNHLAAELAEATGVPPDLARALTRGSSLSALLDATAPLPTPPPGGFGEQPVTGSVMPTGDLVAGGGAGVIGPAAAGHGKQYGSGSGGLGARDAFAARGRRSGGMGGVEAPAAAAATPAAALGPPPQPDFLDMVPWYSGTSADLFKTLFDLMVSVKLFLGRFDMRTMQAATAASMADSFNDTPSEGDGFTYEHLDERPQLWLDFIADTGDGGNPTYAVASALAAPALTVAVPQDLNLPPPPPPLNHHHHHHHHHSKQAKQNPKQEPGDGRKARGGDVTAFTPRPGGCLSLPRGDVLLIGGDLAYPNPSRETYGQRLFRPFSDALPPPPHFHPGRLVVHKPDLPPAWGVQEAHMPADLRGLSPRSSRRASSAALRRYSGPTAFAIPGNHDWIDGLETFTREIQHKGWLGGWLLPQEKSYFALRLPAGWWLFGFDLALVQDIDMQQYRYFANVVEQRMSPDDQVILMTHEPLWLLEWFWHRRSGQNLRQLVRGHLRGRARLHLAGDLHFYMRHSWTEAAEAAEAAEAEAAEALPTAALPTAALPTAALPEAAKPKPPTRSGGMGAPPPRPPSPSLPPAWSRRVTDPDSDASGCAGSVTAAAADSDDALLCCGRSSASASVAASLEDIRPLGPEAARAAAAATAPFHLIPPLGGCRSGSSSALAWEYLVPGDSGDEAPVPSHRAAPQQPQVNQVPHHPHHHPHPQQQQQQQQQRQLTPSQSHAGGGATSDTAGPSGRHLSAPPPRLQSLSVPPSWPHLKPPTPPPRPRQLPGAPSPAQDGVDDCEDGVDGSGVELHGADSGPRPEGDALGGEPPPPPPPPPARSWLQLPPATAPCAACEARQRWVRHPHDPQHLVVNGGGGAFLHPTHVFAGARFPAPHDPAADATAGLYAAVALPCTCGIYSPGAALYGGAPGGRIEPWAAASTAGGGGWPTPPQLAARSAPSSSSLGLGLGMHPPGPSPGHRALPGGGGAAAAPLAGGGGGGISGYAALGPDGEYVCAACYPSPRTSMQLGRRNLHVFRLRNTRFDVIGGVFYFLLVVSVLPRCSHLAEVLEADTPGRALSLLGAAYVDTLGAILGRSYLSAAALALLFMITLGLAVGGGVGAAQSSSASHAAAAGGGVGGTAGAGAAAHGAAAAAAATSPPGGAMAAPRPLLSARLGGFPMQLAFAVAHCLTHVSLAIVLLLLLELGVETCIKYERLGADGPHSLYRWYRAYEEQHFPDPMGLRQSLQSWTLGLYPGVLQVAMSVYDVPELIAVARTAMCAAGGSLEPITRLQAVAYYGGMLAYYWLLATPAMGFVFGLYLYLSVCWCHVHYDEAFSSLREANCKSFCRLHISQEGDLRLYTLALDEVPSRWQEDARWRGAHGGGNPQVVAHEAHYPSRWLPTKTDGARAAPQQGGGPPAGSAAAASKATDDGGGSGARHGGGGAPGGVRWRLVDFVHVPRNHV